MSRISNLTKYPYDYNITEKDFVIGTDGDNKKTKNFPVVALAEYIRNFNNNLSYDRVISIGEITSENNNITINVHDLGNVVYINNKFYIKNTPDTFTFTPVTEGVKVILLYALPDEQIFYMLEGAQSNEAVEPNLPFGALFVQRLIATVDGIEIIPDDAISDNKVIITESTSFANIGQSQKDFNKNIANEVISLTNDIEVTKTEVNFNLATKLNKGTYTGTAQDLKNEIDSKQSSLSSFDESILIENDGNIEGNISLFEEYFEEQECELNFTPIQIVAVYQDGIKLSNSEYEIILPKKIKIKEYVDENIQIEYTHLKS